MDNAFKTWFLHLCRSVPGAVHAILLTGTPDKGPFDQKRLWPDASSDHTSLSHVCQAVLQSKRTVIKSRNSILKKTGEPLDAMACPVFIGRALFGVVAISIPHRTQAMQQAVAQQIQTGVKWLETIHQLSDSAAQQQWAHLVDMVAVGLDHEQFNVASADVANELAERFNCQRVSLGFLNGQRLRIEAISHSSRIDQHAKEIQALKDAMLEALDQGITIVHPPGSASDPLITCCHERLSQLTHGSTICTLPLAKNGEAVGALLLERPAHIPFAANTVAQCEQMGMLLGPVLENRRRDERPLPWKIVDALRNSFASLLGPRRLALKLTIGLLTALAIWLSLSDTTMRISCDAELEAKIRRVIAAPQQGYIARAHARAGDLVNEGDLLATLDDKELRLEQRKWQSQRGQLHKEYRKALAALDRAQVAIITAKRTQAEAQLSLIEQQLARTTLTAPFSGLVVKGDLSQALGTPVTRGEILFKVAPTDEYRVVLKVDDRDIGLVSVGQRGKLKLSSMPHQKIGITVDRLTPVASVEEGRNVFRVEALMADHSDLMRPGMKGVTQIEVGQSKRLWVWARPLVDWLRLFAWNRLP